MCINIDDVTRMASSLADEDSVIELLLVSPTLAAVCMRSVLGPHRCDHCLCGKLIAKERDRTNKTEVQLFKYDNVVQDICEKDKEGQGQNSQ